MALVTSSDQKMSEEEVIEKLRRTNEAVLKSLTKMHLLFCLDLDDDQFDKLFGEDSVVIKRKRPKTTDGLFNCYLTQEGICRLYLLIDFLSLESNIIQEGIFRKCGSAVRQQELKYKLSHGIDVDLDSCQFTPHDCANVLKACLSELPEPLLTDMYFKICCHVSEKAVLNKSVINEESAQRKRIKIFQLLLLLLPTGVRSFVRDLLKLLHKVTLYSESNKMDSHSMATLFAPHLLFPKDLTADDIQKYRELMADELQFMIDNVDEVFKPPHEFVVDVWKEIAKTSSKTSEADVVNTCFTFCERNNKAEDHTSLHLAQLYAHVHSMPNSPAKQRLIKQFNRQNGGRSPVVVKRKTVSKAISCIGSQIRKAGNFIAARSTSVKDTRELYTIEQRVEESENQSPELSFERRAASLDTLLDSRN